MFTLEINGRAIAVVEANEQSARDLIADDDFRDDLRSMESDGEALWNGLDTLVVRPATTDEIEAAEAAMEDDDEEDVEGEIALVFIVPLDDDYDDEDDEEPAA